MSPVAGEVEQIGQRRVLARRDREPVVQPAVDLQFRDRADAEAHAERRHAQQIALQPGGRVEDLVQRIESALEQHQPRADGFGILGHQRPLLRGRQTRRRLRLPGLNKIANGLLINGLRQTQFDYSWQRERCKLDATA